MDRENVGGAFELRAKRGNIPFIRRIEHRSGVVHDAQASCIKRALYGMIVLRGTGKRST